MSLQSRDYMHVSSRHYVWKQVLSQDQRRQYEGVYKVQSKARHLVSAYAAVSVEEGFAEAYSYYVRQPAILEKCDPQSRQCLACYMQPAPPEAPVHK